MNSPVRQYADSDFPGVSVHVHDAGDGARTMPSDDSGSILLDAGMNSSSFRLKLYIPSSIPAADAQFVMTATDGGKFTGPSSGCDGKRAHGRVRDQGEGLDFEIEAGALEIKFAEDGTEIGGKVEVWAGWATGHEAVTLTERVSFGPRATEAEDGGGGSDSSEVKKAREPATGGKGNGMVSDANSNVKVDVDDDVRKVATAEGIEKDGKNLDPKKNFAINRMKDFAEKLQHQGPNLDRIIESQIGIDPKKKRDYPVHMAEHREKVARVMGGMIHKKVQGGGKVQPDRLDEWRGAMMQKHLKDVNAAMRENVQHQGKIEGLGELFKNRNKNRKRVNEPDGEIRRRPRRGLDEASQYGNGNIPETKEESRVWQFRRLYEGDDFGGVRSFSMQGYAASIFIVASFAACMIRYAKVVDRRWNKGTRIL